MAVHPYAAFRATCSSCQASILWASTPAGERMPVNAKTSDNGNVLLRIEPGGRMPDRLVAGVLNRGQAAGAKERGERLHTSHFVDCKNADAHRRSRRP